jgi:tripartite ATP-independent transporter DctP family solute receptor
MISIRKGALGTCGAVLLALCTGRAAAAEAQITLKLAEVHPKGYPTEVADEEFARLVGERSGGRIKVDVYPGAQLGDEKSAIEQVQIGAIAFTRVSSAPMAQFSKQLGVFSLPYIFDSKEHMWAFLNGPGGRKMLDALQPSGFVGLAYYDGGARSFYATKPIARIEDLKGLKLRVLQTEWSVKMVNAFGASATPMPYGQVFSALQTGVIDGAENNAPSYLTASHSQVAKHYLLDHHQRIPEVLVMSVILAEKLPKADLELVQKAAVDSVAKQRSLWDAYEIEALAKVKAQGSVITEVKDLAPFQKAVKPVIDEAQKEFGEALQAIAAARPKKT